MVPLAAVVLAKALHLTPGHDLRRIRPSYSLSPGTLRPSAPNVGASAFDLLAVAQLGSAHMRSTDREERMRAGELGEPARVAIDQQIAVGEFFDADRFVPVEIYVEEAKSKVPLDELERQISKENVYTLTPTGVTKFADFMYRTGMIQQRPASWKEIFFDTVHNLPGN
jgi:hypothetical protein